METRFSVAVGKVEAAVAWLAERGFAPDRIEQDGGDSVLMFAPLLDVRRHALVMALPVHLCAKVGIVVGERPAFMPRS